MRGRTSGSLPPAKESAVITVMLTECREAGRESKKKEKKKSRRRQVTGSGQSYDELGRKKQGRGEQRFT